MEQFTQFLSERLGISQDVARNSLKVLLQFAHKHTTGTEFEELLHKIPGASQLIAEPAPAGQANSLGGLLGGLLGGSAGGAAEALAGLQAAGLDTAKIMPFLRAFVEKAREVAGPETVDEVLKKMPILQGLSKPAG